jgi:hypothetical protein
LERRCFLEALKKEKLGAIEICEHWGHFAGVMEEVKVKIGQVQVGSLGFYWKFWGLRDTTGRLGRFFIQWVVARMLTSTIIGCD